MEATARTRHSKYRRRWSFAAPVRAERFLDSDAAGVWTQQRLYIASRQNERVQGRRQQLASFWRS
jgi:hypothetical protein